MNRIGFRLMWRCCSVAVLVLATMGDSGQAPVFAAQTRSIAAITGKSGPSSKPRSCAGPGVVDVDDFETWIHRQLSAEVVGYGFAISEGGAPVGAGQGGFAQIPLLDNDVLFTHQTDIQVASVSKTITAVALLQQMEKLGITPDDPVTPYLPASWSLGPGFDDWSITFDDVLSHQTGVDQMLAAMINDASEPLPDSNRWEGLELLVARGIPQSTAATSCPVKNDDGTFTLGEPEDPEDGHYGVYCYKNANYALARVLIWRLALKTGDLPAAFDVADPGEMPMASATGYEQIVRTHVLIPAGVLGKCSASGSPAQRSLMYDVQGNVPLVMLTAGADAYGDDESSLLECGPYNWSLSALDLVKVMGALSCGDLLSPASKQEMDDRKMGWHPDSNTAAYPDRFWKGGGWKKTRVNVKQALWPAHPDHPANNPAMPADACVPIGAHLVCPAAGDAVNRIHTCVVRFPYDVDAALVINSDLRSMPDVDACDVLLEAFEKAL